MWPGIHPTRENTTSAHGKISELKPGCAICRDAGWVYPCLPDGRVDYGHPHRCSCMIDHDWQRRQAEFLKYCELPTATEDRRFDTFKAHNQTLADALQAAHDVVAGRINLLVLASGVDRGKTHLAIAICRSWLGKGKSAKYAFVPLLLDELRAGFQMDGDESFNSRFMFYQRVGLLVLDDLGAEVRTAWAVEKLETIIDYRYINQLPTVVTTNCGLDEFTDRIRSRIGRWPNNRVLSIEDVEVAEYTRYKKSKAKK